MNSETDFDYLPFADGPYRMTMGLMALKPADWIEIDSRYTPKSHCGSRCWKSGVARCWRRCRGRKRLAARCWTSWRAFCRSGFRTEFERVASELVNRVSGDRWTVEGNVPDPLGIAGQLVQEDLCILQEVEGELRLTAGVLCFPNRWRLADKLGRPMLAIHEPVPSYAERLGKPVDRFIGMLAPDRSVWRLNWSLTSDPALFQPVGHGRRDADPDITPANAGLLIFLRVERQTLRRLPRTGAVLFTIRTHQRPLEVLEDRPKELARLAEAVRNLPEDTARYKSITPFREALLAYLDGSV